jgi:hypothetical protein
MMCNNGPHNRESLLKPLVKRCVLSIDHDVRSCLHISNTRRVFESDLVKVVSSSSACRNNLTTDIVVSGSQHCHRSGNTFLSLFAV